MKKIKQILQKSEYEPFRKQLESISTSYKENLSEKHMQLRENESRIVKIFNEACSKSGIDFQHGFEVEWRFKVAFLSEGDAKALEEILNEADRKGLPINIDNVHNFLLMLVDDEERCIPILKLLLKRGYKVSDHSVLSQVIGFDNPAKPLDYRKQVFDLLLQMGADINAVTEDKKINFILHGILISTSINGKIDVEFLKFIFEKGFDIIGIKNILSEVLEKCGIERDNMARMFIFRGAGSIKDEVVQKDPVLKHAFGIKNIMLMHLYKTHDPAFLSSLPIMEREKFATACESYALFLNMWEQYILLQTSVSPSIDPTSIPAYLMGGIERETPDLLKLNQIPEDQSKVILEMLKNISSKKGLELRELPEKLDKLMPDQKIGARIRLHELFLHICLTGSPEDIQKMIKENNLDLNECAGALLLQYEPSTKQKILEVLAIFIKNGLDLNNDFLGRPLVSFALKNNEIAIIALFILSGVNISSDSIWRWLPQSDFEKMSQQIKELEIYRELLGIDALKKISEDILKMIARYV